jgi:acetyl-CoA C-acetyltransferase
LTQRRAAIVAPVRTPVGTFGGSLRTIAAEDLAATVIKAVVSRSGIDPERIDDVTFAQSYANSEAPCIGRWAALQAGLPVTVPGLQLDRRCGGGLQAIATAAMMVQTGAADVVVAGGAESMSNIEYYTTSQRWGARAGSQVLYDRLDRGRERSQPEWRFGPISGMIETAENLAAQFGISRDEADEYAARSHQRAAAAWAAGRFDDEIVPVEVPQRRGEPVVVSRDEGVRPDSTPQALGKLRTLMPGGTVTAGNASQQNDAAAACLVVAEDQLEALGVEPLGYLVGWTAAGCEPATMGIGPSSSTRPSRCRCWRCWPGGSGMTRTSSMSAAPASRSVTRSARRGPGCSPPACASCAAAAGATCWRRCASAAARAWPRSSRRPDRFRAEKR